jgi:hypothetical protein
LQLAASHLPKVRIRGRSTSVSSGVKLVEKMKRLMDRKEKEIEAIERLKDRYR